MKLEKVASGFGRVPVVARDAEAAELGRPATGDRAGPVSAWRPHARADRGRAVRLRPVCEPLHLGQEGEALLQKVFHAAVLAKVLRTRAWAPQGAHRRAGAGGGRGGLAAAAWTSWTVRASPAAYLFGRQVFLAVAQAEAVALVHVQPDDLFENLVQALVGVGDDERVLDLVARGPPERKRCARPSEGAA